MAEINVEQLIARTTQTENTPELAYFWQLKYKELLDNNLFILHPETIRLFESPLVDKPCTTLGDIVLSSHLDNVGAIDQSKIRSTIEVAVRFLDALLTCISFSPEAGHIVNGYRKIGLGFSDLAWYLEKSNGSKLEEIDKLGELVSSSAYRASEMLALEKGTCRNWPEISTHLRPKLFELWQNEENKSYRNGLEMSEEFTGESIKNSRYTIVPRRNSNVLMLPPDLEWQIWSDRDQTAPSTPIDTPSLQPSLPVQPVNLIAKEGAPELASSVFVDEQIHNSSLPQFQIGELVVVQNNEVPELEKVYQVIDIHKSESGTVLYELTGGNPELEHKRWMESELKPVELTEILHKVNDETKAKLSLEPVETVKVFSHAMVLDELNNSVMVKKEGEKIDFVGFEVGKNEIPEQVLTTKLLDKYNINASIDYEVGSSVTHTNTGGASSLHLGYLLKNQEVKHPDLGWFSIDNMNILPMYMQVLIQKMQKRRTSASSQVLEINRLQKENEQLKTLQQEKSVVYLKNTGNAEVNSGFVSPNLPNNLVTHVSNSPVSASSNPVMYKSNFHLIHAMSKYALKLEQLVQTNAFGDVTVNIQYDDEGAKVITAFSEKIKGELQQQLNTVLGLVNFLLAKSVTPSEIATQLEKEPKEGKIPLNDLLKVIAASLKEAPENADKINGSLLGHIAAEAVSEVAEAMQTNKPNPTAQPEKKEQEAPKPQQPQQQNPAPQQAPQNPQPPAQQSANSNPSKPQDQQRPMFNNPFSKN